MNKFFLSYSRLLLLVLPLFLLLGCGSKSKTDDPTPPKQVVLNISYSDMKQSVGRNIQGAVLVKNGTGAVVTEVYMPNQATGTINKDLGQLPGGGKLTFRVDFLNVPIRSGLYDRNTPTVTSLGVYPSFIDVDVLVNGAIVKSLKLDKSTMQGTGSRADGFYITDEVTL